MKNDIIKSERDMQRYPKHAFVLSFFFTGLGQIYNGDLSKGIVFYALRVLTLLIIPISTILKSIDSYISFFVFAIVLHIVFWLLSPLEAIYGAEGKDAVNLKRYNSLLFYSIYGVLSTGILICSFLFVSLFISTETIGTNRMNPTILDEECILINRYAINNLDIGDVVVYTDKGVNNISRIIAKEGDTLRYENNAYHINDTQLQLGILTGIEQERMGLENSEDLFYEVNGRRKYPVRVSMIKSPDVPKKSTIISVEQNMLLLSIDDRTKDNPYFIIDRSQVNGKVEGILYSSKFTRLLLQPYLTD